MGHSYGELSPMQKDLCHTIMFSKFASSSTVVQKFDPALIGHKSRQKRDLQLVFFLSTRVIFLISVKPDIWKNSINSLKTT